MLDCSLSSHHLDVLHFDLVLNSQRLDEISLSSHHLVVLDFDLVLNSQRLDEVQVESLPLGPLGRHDLEEDGTVWVDAIDPVPCSESSCDLSSPNAQPARASLGTAASSLEAEMTHVAVAISRHDGEASSASSKQLEPQKATDMGMPC